MFRRLVGFPPRSHLPSELELGVIMGVAVTDSQDRLHKHVQGPPMLVQQLAVRAQGRGAQEATVQLCVHWGTDVGEVADKDLDGVSSALTLERRHQGGLEARFPATLPPWPGALPRLAQRRIEAPARRSEQEPGPEAERPGEAVGSRNHIQTRHGAAA